MKKNTFIFYSEDEHHFDKPWNSLFSQNSDRAHKGHTLIQVMLQTWMIIIVILGKETQMVWTEWSSSSPLLPSGKMYPVEGVI